MGRILLKNANIVNENTVFEGDVLLEDDLIIRIASDISDTNAKVIDLEGKHLLPGIIDDQVHFREPGLTHKGDIASESRAAVAGGHYELYGTAQHQSANDHVKEARREVRVGRQEFVRQLLLPFRGH